MNISLVSSLIVRIEDWSHKFGVQLVNISFAIWDCRSLTLLETTSISIWDNVLFYVALLRYFATIYDHLQASSNTSLHRISLYLQIAGVRANPSLIIYDKLICKKLIAYIIIYFFSYLIGIEIFAVDSRDIPVLIWAVIWIIVLLLELDAEKFRLFRGFAWAITTRERRCNRLFLCRHLEGHRIVIVWQIRVCRRFDELRLVDVIVQIEAEGHQNAH